MKQLNTCLHECFHVSLLICNAQSLRLRSSIGNGRRTVVACCYVIAVNTLWPQGGNQQCSRHTAVQPTAHTDDPGNCTIEYLRIKIPDSQKQRIQQLRLCGFHFPCFRKVYNLHFLMKPSSLINGILLHADTAASGHDHNILATVLHSEGIGINDIAL